MLIDYSYKIRGTEALSDYLKWRIVKRNEEIKKIKQYLQ